MKHRGNVVHIRQFKFNWPNFELGVPTQTTNFIIIAFSCVIGLLWLSTVPPTSGIVANRFGTRYLSTLFGIVMVSHQSGAFVGSYVGGLVIDLYGSLDLAWIMAIIISLFSQPPQLSYAFLPHLKSFHPNRR